MTFQLYHRGILLIECKHETTMWAKSQMYRQWFSPVEVKKVEVKAS